MQFKNLLLATLFVSFSASGSVVLLPAEKCIAAAETAPSTNARAFDEGTLAPLAPKEVLPAAIKSALPKGATTLFCVATKLGNRMALTHGWNAAKGDTHIDIMERTAVRQRHKPGRRNRALRTDPRMISKYTRVARMTMARVESDNFAIRVTPLKMSARGLVISLEWSEEQSAGAFMTVPMLVFVLPQGLGGSVISQDFSTESSTGGNVFYLLHKDKNGNAFLLLTTQAFDAGTQELQRFTGNGRRFERQGESLTQPLPARN